VSNASPPQGSPGTCDFGHGYDAHTWPTTAWIDSFVRLFEIYEIEDRDGHGQELHLQVQQDWRVFSFSDPAVLKQFLVSAVQEEHPLLAAGVRVRLHPTQDGERTDHLLSWAQFSDEIRTRNRYFPQTVPDRDILASVLLGSVDHIQSDVALYRARLIESDTTPAPADMGAPPANKVVGGRANPVGIPYLYLSFALETCIYETRVANHTRVAIGTFHAARDLSVLNLADIEPPDFFDVAEVKVDSVAEQVRRASFHRYLSALGDELRKPVRASDQPTDYIPTQYLCELAKSLGLDGVLYSSSLHPPGRNLVLFDISAAACAPNISTVEITSLSAEWRITTA
jgi:RES domain-containing protein